MIPVKSVTSPARARAYSPFRSRDSQTSSGVLTQTSRNAPCASAIARTRARDRANGAIGAASATPPCRATSAATQPIRSTLRSREATSKPSSAERCWRTSSPSRSVTRRAPPSTRSSARARAIVDLPDPDKPVNRITAPGRGVPMPALRTSMADASAYTSRTAASWTPPSEAMRSARPGCACRTGGRPRTSRRRGGHPVRSSGAGAPSRPAGQGTTTVTTPVAGRTERRASAKASAARVTPAQPTAPGPRRWRDTGRRDQHRPRPHVVHRGGRMVEIHPGRHVVDHQAQDRTAGGHGLQALAGCRRREPQLRVPVGAAVSSEGLQGLQLERRSQRRQAGERRVLAVAEDQVAVRACGTRGERQPGIASDRASSSRSRPSSSSTRVRVVIGAGARAATPGR